MWPSSQLFGLLKATALGCVPSAAHVTGESMKKGVQIGEYQLVYITSELLITGIVKMLVEELYNERMMVFVVDEAHTVKKWF